MAALILVQYFSSIATITHEPRHWVWWYFACTGTSTTSATLLNTNISKVKVMLVFVCFCLH